MYITRDRLLHAQAGVRGRASGLYTKVRTITVLSCRVQRADVFHSELRPESDYQGQLFKCYMTCLSPLQTLIT